MLSFKQFITEALEKSEESEEEWSRSGKDHETGADIWTHKSGNYKIHVHTLGTKKSGFFGKSKPNHVSLDFMVKNPYADPSGESGSPWTIMRPDNTNTEEGVKTLLHIGHGVRKALAGFEGHVSINAYGGGKQKEVLYSKLDRVFGWEKPSVPVEELNNNIRKKFGGIAPHSHYSVGI
jgi:hypothetical protein